MNQNRPLSRRAMLSLRRIKSFVFAWLRSPRCEFSVRLALQKQSFLFSVDSTWPCMTKVYAASLTTRKCSLSQKTLYFGATPDLLVIVWGKYPGRGRGGGVLEHKVQRVGGRVRSKGKNPPWRGWGILIFSGILEGLLTY